MARIILKKGKGESLKRFHPWVFSGAVQKIELGRKEDEPAEGDIVEVYSFDKEFLGKGHFQVGSITVRILSFEDIPIDEAFWRDAILRAYNSRRALGLVGQVKAENETEKSLFDRRFTNAYRLVHGEGDSLPGLIIDIYGSVAVIQAHSAGMFLSLHHIADALKSVYGSSLTAIYDKSSGTAPFKAGLDLNDGFLWVADGVDAPSKDVVYENGNRFIVNWVEGQKTGFFLDQRDNRSLVGTYSNGKRVLNLFCYTGGFSIYALAGGAVSVDSVDSSQKAMNLVDENVALNGDLEGDGSTPVNNGFVARHTSYCEDAIEFMRKCEAGKYDLMIVDPPAFAKHRGALDNALRAYKKLNALAIEKVRKGGIIFTYSCSQVVDKHAFALAVFSAAAQTGRRVRILHRLTQPADHPVNIYHPEGEYLKGLVLYVE
ncbi:MAG: class I SAM-dependent rRNA methyltransferase [Bacteroidales bacterium]|nr:class I SAM-dependent rRNA methyltransferase [Bacteroidales bacterium]